MTPHSIMIINVNIIARIALFSIYPLPQISFLRIYRDFRNWVVSTRMERMAFDESLKG
jgi:hypothetical protein